MAGDFFWFLVANLQYPCCIQCVDSRFAFQNAGTSTLDSDVGSPTVNESTSVAIASPQVGLVFAAWLDGDEGDIHARAATESAGAFTAGAEVSTDTTVNAISGVSIAAPDASTVFVAWFDDDADHKIELDALRASGTTLSGAGLLVVDVDTGQTARATVDVSAPNSGVAFVAWTDEAAGTVEARGATPSSWP
ncbi:MAG: hypothetical protein O3B84_02680 [Chloroflexi bacterium]|nr:hypothetical protein [Chloroflexota bacterium]